MLYLGLILLLTSTSWALLVDTEESDVTLYFYQYPNSSTPIYSYTLNNSTCEISNSTIDLSKNFSMYIHGWENETKDAEYYLLDALVQTQQDGIIIWMEYPYQSSYLSAVDTVTPYGTYVANFFLCLNSTYNYPLDGIRVIGHSLGAHIAGAVGSGCNGKLPVVIGLDPAGPSFDQGIGDRLNADDGVIVEALHTSNVEGTALTNGDVDIYRYGGIVQPECDNNILNVTCNHVVAVTLYANSLYSTNLTATKCALYTSYLAGLCDGNDQCYVGGINPDPEANGKYYVNT